MRARAQTHTHTHRKGLPNVFGGEGFILRRSAFTVTNNTLEITNI